MKNFKFNALFSALFAIIRPVQFNMAAINYVPGTAESQSFDDIPAGNYAVMIVSSSEENYEKDGKVGAFLKLEHKIIEGKYENRKLFNNLFLWSETAGKYAYGTLESICRAQGRLELVSDSTELHNVPMVAYVKYSETRTTKGKNGMPDKVETLEEGKRNSIGSYKKYIGDTGQFQPAVAVAFAQPVASTQQPTAAAATTGAAVAAAPWS